MYGRKTAFLILFVLLSSLVTWSQTAQSLERFKDPLNVHPIDKVSLQIDDAQRVMLAGNVHPMARPENRVGAVLPGQAMDRMVIILRPDPSQEEALQELIRAQQDPGSPYYHQWLTPEAFGERFGISTNDMAQVVNWIEMQGMKVVEVPSSRRSIVFSGSAGQVETAFHTQMRKYSVKGQIHFANATNPEIPQALAEVVRGIVSLHDFRSAPAHTSVPAYTLSNGVNLLMPKDWDTIYDVTPLYSQGLDGSGQTIAVVGRTDIALTDLRTFRANAGLPAKDPQKIFVNGVNPGMPDCQDEVEAALDVEWAGAIAKNATIDFVTAQSGATDGVVLAAQYAVYNNVAPIVTMSYLHCENTLSDGGQGLWGSLWSEAASQGQSVFVTSGDSGAAGCDSASATTAIMGKGVNAICSTPNSTCVGGTEFNDSINPGAYWSATNGTGMSSALSYIPEAAWNESSWAGAIIASGGGVSTIYQKPGWQSAPGVPADGMRDVPDIAASSAVHDAYVIQIQGGPYYVAGTSAAAPSLASVMALVLQNAGGPWGNINPNLYTLASQQATGGPAVFHDITSGNNSVPGVTGYNTGAGYDLVTGLGSVDAFLLVNSWNNSRASNFSLAMNSSNLTVTPSSANIASLSMSAQGGFNAPVTLTAAGAPTGVTVAFSSPTLTPSAPVTMTVTAGANVVAGIYPIAVTGSGGGFQRTVAFTLTVMAPTFTLTPSPTGASVNVGSAATITVTVAGLNGFSSAVALSIAGTPPGVTATFSPTSITSGNGSSTLTLSVGSTASVGVSALAVTGTCGSLTQTQIIILSVANPNYTLTPSATSASVAPGGSVAITLTTAAGTGFNSIVYLSVSGLPPGVTASFSKTSIPAPGNGSSILTLWAGSTAPAGVFTLTLGAVGGGSDKTKQFSLTVSQSTSVFTLSPSATSTSVAPGGMGTITFTTTKGATFNSAVMMSVTGAPSGITASFATPSIAAPGNGSDTLILAVGPTAAAGTTTLTVSATGGGVIKTQGINLTVLTPSFTLTPSASGAGVLMGGSIPFTFTTSKVNGFNSAITLSVSGVPSGVTASFAAPSIAAPGSGSDILTVSVGSTAAAGTFTLTVTASGAGAIKTQSISITVLATFTLTPSATSTTVARGGSATIVFTTLKGTGFNSSIGLSMSALPSGVTGSFVPTTIAAPGSGGSTLKLSATSTATVGTASFTVTAAGGGVNKSQTISLTVSAASFTLTPSATSASVARGSSTHLTLTTALVNGFNSTVTFSVSGAPVGVTASFAPSSIAAPGSGSSTLTVAATPTKATGVCTLTITATGGGLTKTQTISVTVK